MIHSSRIWRSIAILLLASIGSVASAGIGPENVLVVVNGDSHASRTVANHYIVARKIPAPNVVVLQDVPEGLRIDLDAFKTRILRPVLGQIEARGLVRQVRVIAYSAGFPTTVDVSAHTEKLEDESAKKYQLPNASLTALTFFYRQVLADDPNYLAWFSNLYARGAFQRHFVNPFSGEKKEQFEAAEAALENGEPAQGAKIFAELFEEYPTLSPLAIRAAEAHAKADDVDAAKQWLIKAIAAGWWSASYLEDSEPLAEVISDPTIAKVLDRLSDLPDTVQGPIGFDALRGWTGCGHWVKPGQGGMHYFLSCMLGVVHDRGSSVDQAVGVLRRAATADLSRPDGVVGFAKTGDVRSKTRFPGFANALVWLAELGRETEVFSSTLPSKQEDYVGLVLGTATMDLVGKPWRLVPGAIAESLTSHAGNFTTNSQTKLTELLHAGAAMSSGTVTEPYSLQFKFPLPIMHAFYAEGVSAIEAFYLSITSPYQQLIVGDPICQPFATPPSEMVRIDRLPEANQVKIQRESLPLGIPGTATRQIQIYLEGKLIKVSPPTTSIQMNLPEGLSGAVEVRVVLIGNHRTEPRLGFDEVVPLKGEHPIPVAEVDSASEGVTGSDAGVTKVQLSCPGAESIDLLLAGEQVGRVEGEEGSVAVSRKDWGDGPLRLRPLAHFGETRVPGRAIVIHRPAED